MKKSPIRKPLKLDVQTIRQLTPGQLDLVVGAGPLPASAPAKSCGYCGTTTA